MNPKMWFLLGSIIAIFGFYVQQQGWRRVGEQLLAAAVRLGRWLSQHRRGAVICTLVGWGNATLLLAVLAAPTMVPVKAGITVLVALGATLSLSWSAGSLWLLAE